MRWISYYLIVKYLRRMIFAARCKSAVNSMLKRTHARERYIIHTMPKFTCFVILMSLLFCNFSRNTKHKRWQLLKGNVYCKHANKKHVIFKKKTKKHETNKRRKCWKNLKNCSILVLFVKTVDPFIVVDNVLLFRNGWFFLYKHYSMCESLSVRVCVYVCMCGL